MMDTLLNIRQCLGRGELDAAGVTEDCLSRIEAINPSLNAFIRVETDQARVAARESAARYHAGTARTLEGLPLAIKDNIDLAHSPTTAGMLTRQDRIASADATVVQRLKNAGAVIIGKLNMTEAALGADGDNPHFGPCQNPRHLGFSPGGSSSGSAAAVAAGLVPATLGTDTMGSVRIPAAYCGIWGFKPSFGLISTAGSVAVSRHLDHIGLLATQPDDLSLLLEVLAGYDPCCPVSRPIQLIDPSSPLKLGVPDLTGVELETSVAQAWQATLAQLKSHKLDLHPLPALPLVAGQIRRAGLLLCEAELLVEHASDWMSQRNAFSPPLAKLLAWAKGQSATVLAEAIRLMDEARLAVNQWLTAVDFVVMPTTPQRAFEVSDSVPVNQADLTCLANCAGVPAVSLPLPQSPDDLPCGLQVMGRYATDRAVIHAATRIHELLTERQ